MLTFFAVGGAVSIGTVAAIAVRRRARSLRRAARRDLRRQRQEQWEAMMAARPVLDASRLPTIPLPVADTRREVAPARAARRLSWSLGGYHPQPAGWQRLTIGLWQTTPAVDAPRTIRAVAGRVH